MSNGVNKVIIIGNLGADPDVHTFPDGGTVANISVATSETWMDRSGIKQERTEWHRIALRDRGNYKLGQIGAKYLRKGAKVFIEGKLQTRKWQDNQGVDRYTTEIIANEMQMLDSRPQQPNQQGYPAPAQNNQPAQQTPPPAFDDDIPF